jgi:hypothetical protein
VVALQKSLAQLQPSASHMSTHSAPVIAAIRTGLILTALCVAPPPVTTTSKRF